jgi:hypothetical protein
METIGIVILIVTLLAFAAGGIYLLVRYLKKKKEEEEKYDFTTKYGIRVMLSPQTKGITSEVFDMWSDSVVDFWHEKKGWSKEKCYKRLAKTEIEIYDVEYLERAGMKVNGIMWPSSFLIEMASFSKGTTTAPIKRIASLFRHEVSHIIAGYVGNLEAGPNGGEYHHKLFAEVGLGA